jgi:hypothetical protein
MSPYSEFGMIMPYHIRNARGQDGLVKKDDPPINQALADNVRKLKAGRSIDALRLEMKEKNLDVGTSTLHRALKGELGIRVESLEKIGRFFGVPADSLLRPDLGVYEGWPFDDLELFRRVEKLDEKERANVEGAIRATVIELENKKAATSGKYSPSQDGANQQLRG